MKHGSEAGTITCYMVEARTPGRVPVKVGDMTLTGDWRLVPSNRHPNGVPNQLYNSQAEEIGLLTYAAALTLLHWFLATAPWAEARLVKLEYDYSYVTKEVGVGPAIILHSPATVFSERDPKEEA